jgi:hypothetical protein
MPDVRVRVIELTDHILHSYDRKIGEFVATQFKRSGECCRMCVLHPCHMIISCEGWLVSNVGMQLVLSCSNCEQQGDRGVCGKALKRSDERCSTRRSCSLLCRITT